MAWIGAAVRTGIKAGLAQKAITALRKPENQARLKEIGARVVAEARKPENQQKARATAQRVSQRAKSARRRPR